MTLITATERAQLIANGIAQRAATNNSIAFDFHPVAKFFTPDAQATWLITELDPDDPDLAFGLCDLGLGEPELGYVRISELESLRGPLGLPVERDLHFSADKLIPDASRGIRSSPPAPGATRRLRWLQPPSEASALLSSLLSPFPTSSCEPRKQTTRQSTTLNLYPTPGRRTRTLTVLDIAET